MYKIGDVVVYSVSGVCCVEDICKKSFGSFSADYYVLRPLMQKSATVFVPTQNAALTAKMHPVLSKDDFEKTFESVKSLTLCAPKVKTSADKSFPRF